MSHPTPARSVLTRRIPTAPPGAPGAVTEVMARIDDTAVLAQAADSHIARPADAAPHAVDVRPRGRTYGRRVRRTARRYTAPAETLSLTYRALAVSAVICSAGVVALLVTAVWHAI